MTEIFKEFLRSPVQKKFLPVLAALLQAAVFTPITHKATSVIMPVLMAFVQLATTGRPIRKFWKWAFIAWAALFVSSAVMMVFTGAWLAAIVAATVAAYPLSVLFTQPVE